MNTPIQHPRAKALANSAKRPLKTSALNPYAMRRTPHGEARISPRLAALKAKGMSHTQAIQAAENKANYVTNPELKGVARGTTAHMLRRYRQTGELSAVARLTELNARLSNR